MEELNGKTILITGGAGSIGGELTSYFSEKYDEVRIIVLDFSESNMALLQERLKKYKEIKYLVGDIRDKKFVNYIFQIFSVNIVIHCAAYKQVSLMQESLYALIQNNLEGLVNLIEESKLNLVENFLFISTDKAVYPKCYMGMTKRLGEILIMYEEENSPNTNFSALRLGNVLNSKGSVIPIFGVQWRYYKKIFITDKEARRYFISKKDVAKYVDGTIKNKGFNLYVGNYTCEKDILTLGHDFLLKKGINDFEKYIKFVGLRSGEKISEDLTYHNETKLAINNSMLFAVQLNVQLNDEIKNFVNHLIAINKPTDGDKVRKLLESKSKNYFQ